MTRRAAILGLGERGLHWAHTCLNSGWVVRGFDPEPEADCGVAWPRDWKREATISATVQRADWVFCCLPERLELVQMVIQRAQAEAPKGAVIAVASRQHDIDALQGCAIRPGQVLRLSEAAGGGLSLDVTDRNHAEMRAHVRAGFAELAAIRSLVPPVMDGPQEEDAESA